MNPVNSLGLINDSSSIADQLVAQIPPVPVAVDRGAPDGLTFWLSRISGHSEEFRKRLDAYFPQHSAKPYFTSQMLRANKGM